MKSYPDWMKLNPKSQYCLALTLLGSTLGFASDPPLESMLVTANAPVEQARNWLEDRNAISSGDMQLQQPLDINQLLDGIEGVYVSREGGPGGVNSVSIRGAEPNFTVVLVDGVALNDPTNTRGGSFDTSTVSPDHVSRVELIKGPHSLAYGSDALAGVVKLITAPDREERTSLRFYSEAQQYGAARHSGSATLANERHALSVQATREDSGSVWQGSSRALTEGAAHYRFGLENTLLQIGGWLTATRAKRSPDQTRQLPTAGQSALY
mgnify:FL=1